MLQTLQLSGVAYATPPHDELRAPPRPEDVLVPAGPFTLGTNDRALGLRQRAAGARRRAAGVPDRASPGNERALRGVPRGRRLSRTALLERRRLGMASGGGVSKRRSTGSGAAEAGSDGASGGGSRCRRPNRSSTSRSTRPKRSRRGPASGCRRRRSGKRPRRVRIRRRGESRADSFGPLPVARRAASGSRRVHARRRVGMDVVRLHRLPRVHGVSVRRVLRGLLRRRAPRAPRRLVGDRPAGRTHHVPELGLPAAAAALQRRPAGGRRMSATRRDRRALLAGRARHGIARGGAARADFDAEGAPAEVVLRRARLGALRRDHPAARVLLDARRALDPRAACRRDRRADGRRHADRARVRNVGQDAPAARRGRAATVRAVRRERGDAASKRAEARARVPRARGPARGRRLRAPPAAAAGERATAARVPRQHDREPPADTADAVPLRRRRDARRRTTHSCSASIWSRAPRGWSQPTTTRRA